jgi:hypothetical protein
MSERVASGSGSIYRERHIEPVDGATRGIGLIRRLAAINMALVALQQLSAGFFLSGYGRGASAHALGAQALLLGAMIQAVTAAVLRRRRRVPAWVGGLSIGLFAIVLVQVALGYNKLFWLHVPIGVGMVGGLMRLRIRLDAMTPNTGRRP